MNAQFENSVSDRFVISQISRFCTRQTNQNSPSVSFPVKQTLQK